MSNGLTIELLNTFFDNFTVFDGEALTTEKTFLTVD